MIGFDCIFQRSVVFTAGGVGVASAIEIAGAQRVDRKIAFGPHGYFHISFFFPEESGPDDFRDCQRHVGKGFRVAHLIVEFFQVLPVENRKGSLVAWKQLHFFGNGVAVEPQPGFTARAECQLVDAVFVDTFLYQSGNNQI